MCVWNDVLILCMKRTTPIINTSITPAYYLFLFFLYDSFSFPPPLLLLPTGSMHWTVNGSHWSFFHSHSFSFFPVSNETIYSYTSFVCLLLNCWWLVVVAILILLYECYCVRLQNSMLHPKMQNYFIGSKIVVVDFE